MKLMRSCGLLICIVAIVACTGFADEEKVHPERMPDDYEWSMWIAPSTPPGDQFETYADRLASSLPALHLLAETGVLSPTLDILHAHAQLILHVLEGTDGPHANLVLFVPGETVTNLLAPLRASLDILERTNSRHNSGIVYMKGGLLWVIDWALPQLDAYAREIYRDSTPQYLQARAVGNMIQYLMLQARDSAIACIEATDMGSAAQHLLQTSAFLFAALGSPFSPQTKPVAGMGLYFLTHNLLGWAWFGS